jgi:anti-sigma28 factor (negative regulator of flagellin synthesis)
VTNTKSLLEADFQTDPGTDSAVALLPEATESTPWTLASTARSQRIKHLRSSIKNGHYRVPTKKLAPILTGLLLATEKDSPLK